MPIDVLMTQLSPTMTEGKIVRWLKQEGEPLTSGEVLAEVETDKATMEVEVVDEGVLHSILAPEGTTVPVGAPIAIIAEEGEEVPSDYVPAAAAAPAVSASVADAAAQPAPSPAPTDNARNEAPSSTGRIKASPLARRMARKLGLNLSAIQGTGPGGRITKADVERASQGGIRLGAGAPAATPTPRPLPEGPLPYHEDEFERLENSMMRKAIARRLVESKQHTPHFYLHIDIAMSRLLDLRTQLNEAADGGFKLSVNDLIIRAVAKALTEVPEANASWTPTHTLRHRHAHISVAVAVEGGLITPVIRYAEQKSLVEISNEMKSLAERARAGALQPEEYTGGTFSISNLGMFGISQFSAVINPPEGAILAVGATEERAVVEDGEIRARSMMTVTMSCDHRVIDGAVGASFLAAFKRYMEAPASLLL